MDKISVVKSFLKAGLVLVVFSLFYTATSPGAWATGVYYSQIPASYEQQYCSLCHDSTLGFKDFALEFVDNGYSFEGLVPPKNISQTEIIAPDDEEGKQGSAISLILPNDAARGEKIQLQARVTVDGRPVEGRQVEFFEDTNLFVGVPGKMSLGTATTNQLGVATINYWPRATEEQVQITALAVGDAKSTAAKTDGTLSLIVGGPLVHSFEGLKIPFLGSWTVVLVVLAVWGAFGYVVFTTLQISRLSKKASAENLSHQEEQQTA